MKTSDNISNIAPALLKAQKSIKFAVKDAKNPHFKSSYADLGSVIDAIKAPLNDNGILFMQTPSPSAPGTLSLTTRLVHESGEWIEDTATMPLPKADPQGFGSAMTYCRRYALAAVVGVYQDDDDGNHASLGMHDKLVADFKTAIAEAADMDALKALFTNAANSAKKANDQAALAAFTKAKDQRKAELTTETEAA